MTPIFIFSQPRAGSTLLQRLMAAHPEIATSAEPWFLLPLFSIWDNLDCFTNYNYRLSRSAILDMASRLPGGEARFRAHQKTFCKSIYRDLAGAKQSRYFLDKTPRYHLILPEILKTFPEARFIFLWRNPLAVVASMCDTWYESNWNIHEHHIDLFHGANSLVNAANELGERACCLKYEDLVTEKNKSLDLLARYLEISPFEGNPAPQPKGKYGDPTGQKQYDTVTSASNDKWKKVFCTPIRKRWGRSYLNWLGDDRLSSMGYSIEEIKKELSRNPTTWRGVPNDLYCTFRGLFYSIGEPVFWLNKWRNFQKGYPTYEHK